MGSVDVPGVEARVVLDVEAGEGGGGEDAAAVPNASVHGSLIEFPVHFTSLSPMLGIGPRSRLRIVEDEAQTTVVHWDVDTDAEELHGAAAGWLAGNRARYGPYVH